MHENIMRMNLIIDFCIPIQTFHKFPNWSPSCHQNKTHNIHEVLFLTIPTKY